MFMNPTLRVACSILAQSNYFCEAQIVISGVESVESRVSRNIQFHILMKTHEDVKLYVCKSSHNTGQNPRVGERLKKKWCISN